MRALVVFSMIQFYREMLPVAQSLQRTGEHEVFAVINWDGAAAESARRECVDLGFGIQEVDRRLHSGDPHLHGGEDSRGTGTDGTRLSTADPRAHRRSAAPKPRGLLGSILYPYSRQRLALAEGFRCLREVRPDVILLGPYMGYRLEHALCHAALAKRIPTLILPVFDLIDRKAHGLRKLWQAGRVAGRKMSRFDSVVARLVPDCVFEHDDRRVLMLPANECLAARLSGLQGRDVLAPAHGRPTRIAVVHEMAKRLLVQDGRDPAILVVTGKPRLDETYHLLQRSAGAASPRAWGPGDTRRVVLFSVSPLHQHGFASREDFWGYLDMVLRGLVERADCRVVVSVHPVLDPTPFRELEEKYGVTVAEKASIYELMPTCDLFVNIFSNTFAYAIACRKPVLVPDLLNIDRFGFYRGLYRGSGTVVVSTLEELRRELQRILGDQAYYASLREAQELAAGVWASHFDGRATERITGLILEVAAGQKGQDRIAVVG